MMRSGEWESDVSSISATFPADCRFSDECSVMLVKEQMNNLLRYNSIHKLRGLI